MADEAHRNAQTGISTATGNVSIQYADKVITGDLAEYDEKTGDGVVDGNAWYTDPTAQIHGQKAEFNSNTKLGALYRAAGNFGQRYFFNGVKIVRVADDRYEITYGAVTTCPQDHPHWLMEADSVDLTVEGYAYMKGMVFRAGGWPIFYLPYMIVPAKTKRATGFLTPGGGYSSKNGMELRNEFFWAISENTDATITHHYMGESGNLAGLEYRYIFGPGTAGTLNAVYMKETDPEKTADRNLWNVIYVHGQTLPWNVKSFVNLNLESENSLNREYGANVDDRTKNYNDSYVVFSKSFSTRSLSLLAREQKSTDPANASRVQRSPELKFVNQKEALFGSPVYGSMESSYSSLQTDTGIDEGKTSFDVDRFDIYPQVSYPVAIAPWLSLEAAASYRHTWYSRGVEPATGELYDNSFSRQYYYAALSLTGPKVFRIFEMDNPARPKLKHLITPIIAWGYIPGYEFDGEDRQRVKTIDSNIDGSNPANAISLTIQNSLLAKEVTGPEDSKTSQILTFNITESYDLNEANRTDIADPDKRPFSSIQFDLSTRPIDWTYFRLLTTYSFYDQFWDASRLELGVKLGSVANIALDRSYTWGNVSGMNGVDSAWDTALLELFLPWGLSADFSVIYDEVEARAKDSMARIRFRDDCWGFALNFQKRDVTRSEADGSTSVEEETRFFFTITLIGVGDVLGAEQPALARKKI
ncbi:MAG: LPS-assembly protein LptD [Nitrospinae bacterium]|nr:LPS-assembly protein LptD [Nitrospinota bacterium]